MIRWLQNVSKKWLITAVAAIAVIVVVGVTLMNGGTNKATQGSAANPQQRAGARSFPVETQAAKMLDVSGGQIFTGSITPQYTTNISAKVSGRVTELMVKAGDRIKKGQPIARIDTTTLEQQVAQSQSSLVVSQAQLQKATNDQVNGEATAEKQLSSQKANLDKTLQDQQNTLAAAKQQVVLSQANYNKAISDQQNAIATSKQQVAISQENLSNAINTYNQNVANAQNTLSAQQDTLQGQQLTTNNNLLTLQLAVQQAITNYTTAVSKGVSADITVAQQKLQAAQLALDQAQQSPSNQVVSAQAALTKAQTDLAAAQNSQTVQIAQEQLNRDMLALTNAQSNLALVLEANGQSLQKDQLSFSNTQSSVDTNTNVAKTQVAQSEQAFVNAQSKDSIAVSNAQFQQAQTNLRVLQEQLQDGVLLSPVDGVVSAINTPLGQNAGTQASIVSVATLDPIQATINVSESNIGKMKVGMEMKVNVPTLNKTFDGVILAIRPTPDAVTKSYGVDIKIDDPNNELLPGMFATSSLKSEGRKAIMVPADAVLSQPSGNAVFIVQDGKAKKVSVKVGTLTSAQIEIVSGLNEGDQVVVKGQELLSDKASVQVVQPGQENAGTPQGKQGAQGQQGQGQQGGQSGQRPQSQQGGQRSQGQSGGQQGQGQQGPQADPPKAPQVQQPTDPQQGKPSGQDQRAGGGQ